MQRGMKKSRFSIQYLALSLKRAIVTVEGKYETVPNLSNSAIPNDLE